jgi:malate permease and related proteins
VLGIVITAFFLGWIISLVRPLPASAIAVAEKYVLMCALPALIISSMSQVVIETALLVPIGVAWGSIAASALVVVIVARLYAWSFRVTGALLLVAVLGNTSFLGLGMVEGLLSEDHLAAAIAYDQLGTFLALSLWGAFVTSTFGGSRISWRDLVGRLLRFAPFVALLVSIPVRWLEVPDFVYTGLDGLGRTVAPVAMATVGMRFRLRLSSRVRTPALWGLSIKMLLVPGLVACVVWLTNSGSDVMWSTSLLQSAAPPMITAGIVATRAGFDEELVAFIVGVGTIVGFVSVPAFSLLL